MLTRDHLSQSCLSKRAACSRKSCLAISDRTRSMRRSRPVDPNGDKRGHIKDIVSIRQRPAAVEDRAVPGQGGRSPVRAEQQLHRDLGRTSYPLRDAGQGGRQGYPATVVTALIKQAKKLPKELYKSLTWDRGKELTDHRRFTLATNIDVYFCASAKPVATRVEREYQWPAATILPEGHRLVGALASPSEQSGSSAKRTTT